MLAEIKKDNLEIAIQPETEVINNEKPNYYAIIPATVRYDKKLSSTAKLMYSEITALSNKYGYCCASNKYFANLYEISIRQVQNILSELNTQNYINVVCENQQRFIYIGGENNFVGVRKKLHKGVKKTSQNHEENFTHNIINNNIFNKYICSEQNSEQVIDVIILKDNTEYFVTDTYIEKMKKIYSDVDIESEILKMNEWFRCNPTRKKTRKGIERFINSWLSRQHDKTIALNTAYQKQRNDLPPYYEPFEE